MARSGRSSSCSPATTHSAKQRSLFRVLRRRGLVEFELHALHAIGELLARELLAKATHHDRKCERRRLVRLPGDDRGRRHPPQSFRKPRVLELSFQDFALRLREKWIRRIPAHEDFVEKPARRL